MGIMGKMRARASFLLYSTAELALKIVLHLVLFLKLNLLPWFYTSMLDLTLCPTQINYNSIKSVARREPCFVIGLSNLFLRQFIRLTRKMSKPSSREEADFYSYIAWLERSVQRCVSRWGRRESKQVWGEPEVWTAGERRIEKKMQN